MFLRILIRIVLYILGMSGKNFWSWSNSSSRKKPELITVAAENRVMSIRKFFLTAIVVSLPFAVWFHLDFGWNYWLAWAFCLLSVLFLTTIVYSIRTWRNA